MKDLSDLQLDLKEKRAEFNRYRIVNGHFGKSQYKEWLLSQNKIEQKEGAALQNIESISSSKSNPEELDKASVKRYERTIRQGYFRKQRRF